MTVHNPAYQGNYPPEILDKLFMMNYDLYENGKLRFNNCLSYLKAGLVYADRITTVSRTYKNEPMWSHYADSENGICLKFKTINKDGKQFINLYSSCKVS